MGDDHRRLPGGDGVAAEIVLEFGGRDFGLGVQVGLHVSLGRMQT
jgi:hypothetical protein